MTVSEKFKTIDNKIDKKKAQYDLDRQTAKFLAFSSGNISKYGSLTEEDVLPEKGLLEKATTFKIWIFAIKEWAEKAKQHCKKQY